jgi:hypothetical protein
MTRKNLDVLTENKEYRINNLNGFIEFVQLMSQQGYVWFRGQSVAFWDIEPGLTRTKVYPGEYEKADAYEIKKIYYQTTDFNKAVDEAIAIVESDARYNQIKQLNLTRLQFILLAQHYGLTTPVVDWTTNPDIALFFSLYHDKSDPEFSPIIYATNPNLLNFNSDITVNDESIYNVFSADNEDMEKYISQNLKYIEGTNDRTNSFIWPVAIESQLNFSHRITFQSGKFTINGPKKPFENTRFKNTLYSDRTGKKTQPANISAEININKKDLISALEIYLNNFGYTANSVLRLGDSKSKLLDTLFKEVQENHKNYPLEKRS